MSVSSLFHKNKKNSVLLFGQKNKHTKLIIITTIWKFIYIYKKKSNLKWHFPFIFPFFCNACKFSNAIFSPKKIKIKGVIQSNHLMSAISII